MKIKKFAAPTVKEALAKVKQELGKDAVILHSKKVKQGGVLDFFAKELFEVTAAIDESDQPVYLKPQSNSQKTTSMPKQTDELTSIAKMTELGSEVHELKSVVHQVAEHVKHAIFALPPQAAYFLPWVMLSRCVLPDG